MMSYLNILHTFLGWMYNLGTFLPPPPGEIDGVSHFCPMSTDYPSLKNVQTSLISGKSNYQGL